MHKHASKPFGSKVYGSLEIAPFFQPILLPGNSFPRVDVDRGNLLTYLHTSRMDQLQQWCKTLPKSLGHFLWHFHTLSWSKYGVWIVSFCWWLQIWSSKSWNWPLKQRYTAIYGMSLWLLAIVILTLNMIVILPKMAVQHLLQCPVEHPPQQSQ